MHPARKTERRSQRGVGAIEFVMVVVPTIFLTTSVFEMSLASWQFHSMAYAIEVADRYACSHGRTCSKGGNACTIRVQDVANMILAQAPALSSSKLNVTLTTHAATVTCNPLSFCTSNTNQFPSSTDNGVGNDITISATYPVTNPIPMMWFGSTANSGGGTWILGATTKGNIVY
jgi:Flp pilus assembly protein TadG